MPDMKVLKENAHARSIAVSGVYSAQAASIATEICSNDSAKNVLQIHVTTRKESYNERKLKPRTRLHD